MRPVVMRISILFTVDKPFNKQIYSIVSVKAKKAVQKRDQRLSSSFSDGLVRTLHSGTHRPSFLRKERKPAQRSVRNKEMSDL